MFKAVMIILMFINGEATSIFDPAPVFETLEACKASYEENKAKFAPPVEGAAIHVFCASDEGYAVLQ